MNILKTLTWSLLEKHCSMLVKIMKVEPDCLHLISVLVTW